MQTLTISYNENLLTANGLSAESLEQELPLLLAVKLFELRRLSLNSAAELVGLSNFRFKQELKRLYTSPNRLEDNKLPGHREFEAEVMAFERLKPELLKTHRGQFVAIYQEKVVEVGDDEMELLNRMDKRFGNVPYYVELVQENTPRKVRITSIWKARK